MSKRRGTVNAEERESEGKVGGLLAVRKQNSRYDIKSSTPSPPKGRGEQEFDARVLSSIFLFRLVSISGSPPR